MLLVVLKFLDLCVESVLLELEFLGLVIQDLLLDLRLESEHGLLEHNEKSAGAVKLVDQLIAFLKELGRDNVLDVLCLVLEPSVHVSDLLVFDVHEMHVVLFLLCESITTYFELFLAISDYIATEVLNSIVKVFPREDHTRPWSQRFHLSTPIGQLSQEDLHGFQFFDQV